MRQSQHGKKPRGRGRKQHNPLSRVYDSSGPDVKIRGTASHIADKYVNLARDAQSSGDRVGAENYLQHAEHYFRIVAAAQAQMQPAVIDRQGQGQGDGATAQADASEAPRSGNGPAPEEGRGRRGRRRNGARPEQPVAVAAAGQPDAADRTESPAPDGNGAAATNGAATEARETSTESDVKSDEAQPEANA